MTISIDGISPEQCKLNPEILRFDIESLSVGKGAWVDFEAVWADKSGSLFIDVSYPQLDDTEVKNLCITGCSDPEEFAYVYCVKEGYVVSCAHFTEPIRVQCFTSPETERIKYGHPVCGFLQDQPTLSILNEYFLVEFEHKIPGAIPST